MALIIKYGLTIMIAVLGVQLVHAQNGILRLFDQSRSEAGVFLDIVNDNDTLIFYRTERDSLNRQGIGFYRIDTFGNVLNKRLMVDTARLFSSSSWARKGIIKTSDSHFVMTGTTNAEIGSPVGAPYFVKLDKDLNIVNRVIYDADIFTANASLIEDESGFLLLTTITQPNNTLAYDILVIKTDRDGNELWQRRYGSFENSEVGLSIVKVGSNEYIIQGNIADYPDFDDPHWPDVTWGFGILMAIDSSGNELWRAQIDTALNEMRLLHKALPLADGDWICSGATYEKMVYPEIDVVEYFARPIIYRLDSQLNIVWEQVFSVKDPFDDFRDLNYTHDGHFLATGFLYIPDETGSDGAFRGVHYKFTEDGDSIWMRQDSIYPGGIMRVNASEILSSGSIMSIGWDNSGPYGQTGFIMKMTKDGCIDTLNCFPFSSTEDVILDGDALTIYPNPSLHEVTIDLPEEMAYDRTEVVVRDITGQTVHQGQASGVHVQLHVADWAAGHYFVELRNGANKIFGRFVKQ